MLDVGSQHNTAQRRRESNLRRAPLIETDDKAFLPLGNLGNCGALRSAWWCPTKNGVDSLTLRQVIEGSIPSGLGKCGALRWHGGGGKMPAHHYMKYDNLVQQGTI